jgi:hypothetical protein
MYKVTGNTYQAKEVLKKAGFTYDNKAWYGDEAAKTELDRITTASYSRANQKAIAGCQITNLGQ